MPVSQPTQDYIDSLPVWSKMRALELGEHALKGKIGTFESKEFLPEFEDKDDARYNAYVKRAVYYNFTGWTITGLLGSVFRKDHTWKLPDTLSYIETNVDGAGSGINDFLKFVTKEALTVGRIGLLTDVPVKEVGIEVLPKTVTYCAESIIGYKTSVKNGNIVLSQVRLKEQEEIKVDEFTCIYEDQYRVLALDGSGYYYQQLYGKDDKPKSAPVYPTRKDGSKLDYIPFVICGAEDNKPNIDKPPLYDIAVVNLGHYRNSADYEETIFVLGQAMLAIDIGETSVDQWEKLNPNGVKFGSRRGIAGKGLKAELLQINETQAHSTAMDSKVTQMVGLGARYVKDRTDRQTATSSKIGEAQQNSGLSTLVGNVEDAFRKSLSWMADFIKADADAIEFAMNRNFFDKELTAQDVSAIIMLADSGYIAKSDVRHQAKRSGLLRPERADEDIDSEIDTDPPIF